MPTMQDAATRSPSGRLRHRATTSTLPVSTQLRATRSAGRRTSQGGFPASFSLEMAFTLLGFLVATFLISAFGSDLLFGWPFLRASLLYDVNCVVCGLALAYLSWNVLQDLRRGRL
jgi:hypothetical protein